MKKLLSCAVILVLAGCASKDVLTRQEADAMKAELLANDETKAAALRQELTGVDQKYVTVQQLQMEVKKKLDDLDKLQKQLNELSQKLEAKVNVANTNVLKLLEFEERLLAERLGSLRSLIEELKKK